MEGGDGRIPDTLTLSAFTVLLTLGAGVVRGPHEQPEPAAPATLASRA